MHYLYTEGKSWKILLILVIQVFCQTAYSQEMVVSGTILNEQNQRITGAEIRLGKLNTRSNSKGTFLLKTDELPSRLSVKHPQYKHYLEIVRAPRYKSDTIFLEIFLEGKETELEEVTVNSSRINWVYPKENTHIIDYTLIDNEILLLCKENHKFLLRRLDSIGKKIVDLRVQKNPTGLFEDCSGGIHLVYTDSIFELKMIRNSIGMLRGYTYDETMSVLNPCALASPNNFIVKRMGPHNKSIDYIQVDRTTKRPTLLYTSIDRKQMRGLDEYSAANDISAELANPNIRYANLVNQPTDREKFQNQMFYRQVLSKPLYVPILEINDSLFVYDHIKDSALVYTLSGEHIRSFAISYHYFENWKSELLVNEERTKLYAKYETDGLVTLRQINPSTGKVMNLDILEKHIYPIHLQIRDNAAYYLYKHYTDNSIHYLYKQPLKE